MSTQTPAKQEFSSEALQTLNNLCDEFRRRVKRSSLESNGCDTVANAEAVWASAKDICDSDWLLNFRETSPDERTRRAA